MQKYLITDPCYVMSDEQYDAIGEATNWEMHRLMPVEIKGVGKCLMILGTPCGDGSLEKDGYEIGVDSGQLCLIELEDGYDEHDQDFGYFHDGSLNGALARYYKILSLF